MYSSSISSLPSPPSSPIKPILETRYSTQSSETIHNNSNNKNQSTSKFSMILPVLFYEYLSISITKSLIPQLLLDEFKGYTYVVIGIMETIKGLLAFISCPLFGRISDQIGRKYCLLVSVIGTSLPVCILAFTNNIYIFVIVMSLSGFFSATFPLTFAYIADCVEKNKRAPAYGLALAAFGLSFCIGPVTGSYLASQYGNWAVFLIAFALLLMNIGYILVYLPETVKTAKTKGAWQGLSAIGLAAYDHLPSTWNVSVTLRIFNQDPFMRNLATVVFLYYTAVWALVSTLVVHVTRYLGFTTVQLGVFMSAYGLATMFSEAILVRFIVPMVGEKTAIQIGLAAFATQCLVVAFADSASGIAASVLLSMLANLVYPAISSLVSRVVSEEGQGEALGALNGIKALTEGFGPLIFGTLMSLFESSATPGAPYLLGGFFSLFALLHCFELPLIESEEYGYDIIHIKKNSDNESHSNNNRRYSGVNYSIRDDSASHYISSSNNNSSSNGSSSSSSSRSSSSSSGNNSSSNSSSRWIGKLSQSYYDRAANTSRNSSVTDGLLKQPLYTNSDSLTHDDYDDDDDDDGS